MLGPYGKGKGGGGKGKSGGGLRDFKHDVKVWIGGLPANSCSKELNMALKEHMGAAGTCSYVEVGKSGNGGAAFKTAEEAQQAITTLNGSAFQDSVIQVDVWTKKEAS